MDFLTIFSVISVLVLFIYSLLFGFLFYGYGRSHTPERIAGTESKVFVSVIIPFRNEQNHIKRCTESVLRQDYPSGYYEIIFCDDHSYDQSASIVKSFCRGKSNVLVIHLSKNENGKKAAVMKALTHAKGELILFTDADCIVPETWISSHAIHFRQNKKPLLTIGLVDYMPWRGILPSFLHLEFQSLIAATAGSTGIRRPVMCNGANLAVSALIYQNKALDLKSHISSGDDVYLLHEVKKIDRHRISILLNSKNIVKTEPPQNLPEFVHQRLRWSSKAKSYTDLDTLILGLSVLSVNIIFLVSIILSLIYGDIALLLTIYGVKTAVDTGFLFRHMKFMGKQHLLWYLPLFQWIYPVYATIIGLSGFFVSYRWKGRTAVR